MTLAKYELIDAEKAHHKIARMCAWLGVSRSGYYEWRGRPASATAQRRTLLAGLVAEIFADSHETYGYRRVHAALARRGEHCSAELVRALMREQGLIPAQVRAFRPATTLQGDFGGIPDLVGRDFTAARPGIKLVGDVTYVRTWEGFLYLATVIDCHSKVVLGWAMADHYRTELVTDAIRMAAGTGVLQGGAVFHTDRGSNYTSDTFGGFLTGLDIRRSVGRTGVCWDNAMAESFFSAIKNEWLHRFVFTTRAKAKSQVIRSRWPRPAAGATRSSPIATPPARHTFARSHGGPSPRRSARTWRASSILGREEGGLRFKRSTQHCSWMGGSWLGWVGRECRTR